MRRVRRGHHQGGGQCMPQMAVPMTRAAALRSRQCGCLEG